MVHYNECSDLVTSVIWCIEIITDVTMITMLVVKFNDLWTTLVNILQNSRFPQNQITAEQEAHGP